MARRVKSIYVDNQPRRCWWTYRKRKTTRWETGRPRSSFSPGVVETGGVVGEPKDSSDDDYPGVSRLRRGQTGWRTLRNIRGPGEVSKAMNVARTTLSSKILTTIKIISRN